jgi:AcrR family transcriptional regulator
MGKRGPARQISEEQLLDAALALVDQGGLSALTMSALARSLSVSVSGLYRYVADLGALFARLQTRALARYAVGLDTHLAGFDARLLSSPAAQAADEKTRALARVWAAFLYYLAHRRAFESEHFLLDAFLSEPDPVLRDEDAVAINTQVTAILDRCGRTLSAAADVEAIAAGDESVRTHLVWAALHGLLHFEKRDRVQPEHLHAHVLVDPLLSSLLIGFGAQRSLVEAARALV